SGERYEADLVVQAQLRGQESFILIHVEHQAQAQADFGRRMFRYFARLHDRYALPVYPIVLFSYARPRRPEPSVYRVMFGDWVILEFQYRVIQLNRLRWRDFVRRPNPIASALMAKMAIAPSRTGGCHGNRYPLDAGGDLARAPTRQTRGSPGAGPTPAPTSCWSPRCGV